MNVQSISRKAAGAIIAIALVVGGGQLFCL